MNFPDRPFLYAELPELQITPARLRAGLDAGDVRRVARGVHVPGASPDDPETRARAISMVLRPGLVVCDRTAAWVHGVDAFGLAERALVPTVETCALRGESRSRLSDVHGRTRDLLARDVLEVDGILVTTPIRTSLDLGCHLRFRDAVAVVDQLRRVHGLRRADLARELPRFRGCRGVVQLRRVLALSDHRAESQRETWVRLALLGAGLPPPELQVWVDVEGRPTYRLDLAYRQQRIAIEYDGAEFHDSPERRRDDSQRRQWLRDSGWTVIVVRNGDFTGDRLLSWTNAVRHALAGTYSTRRW